MHSISCLSTITDCDNVTRQTVESSGRDQQQRFVMHGPYHGRNPDQQILAVIRGSFCNAGFGGQATGPSSFGGGGGGASFGNESSSGGSGYSFGYGNHGGKSNREEPDNTGDRLERRQVQEQWNDARKRGVAMTRDVYGGAADIVPGSEQSGVSATGGAPGEEELIPFRRGAGRGGRGPNSSRGAGRNTAGGRRQDKGGAHGGGKGGWNDGGLSGGQWGDGVGSGGNLGISDDLGLGQ